MHQNVQILNIIFPRLCFFIHYIKMKKQNPLYTMSSSQSRLLAEPLLKDKINLKNLILLLLFTCCVVQVSNLLGKKKQLKFICWFCL